MRSCRDQHAVVILLPTGQALVAATRGDSQTCSRGATLDPAKGAETGAQADSTPAYEPAQRCKEAAARACHRLRPTAAARS